MIGDDESVPYATYRRLLERLNVLERSVETLRAALNSARAEQKSESRHHCE